ncbi:TetR/AcrR family transcriptional regulator [Silvibacterium sp.]|uniref:TetR/AcrR family transcriptional regulator n=1 Tax=Silvibacterium sp. TaxID=1964179 RepID=UPI0039E4B6A1
MADLPIKSKEPLSLRDRKKELTRAAIRDCAEKLFEQHGYDNVTVAEIADAANISVKTLFTYIRSKEDLLFQDTSLIDTVAASLHARAAGLSPAYCVAETLIRLTRQKGSVLHRLTDFQRGYGKSDVLHSRLLRLWDEYEEILAGVLAAERRSARPDAATRLEAAQLVTLIRSTTWAEVHRLATSGSNPDARFRKWLRNAAEQLSGERASSGTRQLRKIPRQE